MRRPDCEGCDQREKIEELEAEKVELTSKVDVLEDQVRELESTRSELLAENQALVEQVGELTR